jgi:hypothetical protein
LAAFAGILLLGTFAVFAGYDRELPWVGRDPTIDQTFLRHISTHHEQRILLASMAAERTGDPRLRALSKLMVSSRGGSLRVDAFAQRHRVELGIRGLLLVQVAIENRAKPVRMPVKGVGLWVEAGA